MDAEIGIGMRFDPARNLRKPRAGHQNARGGYPVLLERFFNGAVYGVRHSEVIGVNNEQTRIRRITEALRNGFGRGRTLCAEGGRKR